MKLHISLFTLAAVLSSEAHAQQSDVDPAAQALGASSNKLICETVSPEFPYAHKYIIVNDVKLAYVEIGKGDPIILTHGNPTSSYMWRNVIPELAKYGRVIALDAVFIEPLEINDGRNWRRRSSCWSLLHLNSSA